MGRFSGFNTGNEQGRRQGSGSGAGKGRNKGGSYGPGGFCVCIKCGEKITHRKGVKCTTQKCSQCGHTMIREEMISEKIRSRYD